jgi:hypothetical protein
MQQGTDRPAAAATEDLRPAAVDLPASADRPVELRPAATADLPEAHRPAASVDRRPVEWAARPPAATARLRLQDSGLPAADSRLPADR